MTTARHRGGLGYSLKLLTFKAVQASRQERRMYLALLRSVSDPSRLIFIDECSVGKNAGRRRRGWGKKGTCVPRYELFRGENKSAEYNNYSLLAAVDMDGFITDACQRVFAKTSKNDKDPTHGTVDRERFYQWVLFKLVPILENRSRGQIVVMDNATIHKDVRILEAIENAGEGGHRVFWNAAYSPDLNPIERCFSNYKRYLRKRYKAFSRNQDLIHFNALRLSVTGNNMKNYYNGTAFQGSIRNVPSSSYMQEEEAFAVAYALGVVDF